MKKTAIILAASTIAMAATPAMAQSSDEPFTGLRVEALGGFDTSRAGSSTDDEVNEDNDQSIDGFTYGGAIGYDFNAGGVILGLEAEVTDSTAETEFDAGDFEGFGLGNVETGRDIFLGARAGILATDSTLVYAKGGYTNARYNLNSSFNGEEFRSAVDADGWRIGAGVEQAISDNAFAKIEYRYSNYENAELDFEDAEIPDVDLGQIDTDRHQVMVGVGYRF